MVNCCVPGCKYTPNVSYHKLPREESRRKLWIEAIKRDNLPNRSVICSKHFPETVIDRTLSVVRLYSQAVPQLFLDNNPDELTVGDPSKSQPNNQEGKPVKQPSVLKLLIQSQLTCSCKQLQARIETLTKISKNQRKKFGTLYQSRRRAEDKLQKYEKIFKLVQSQKFDEQCDLELKQALKGIHLKTNSKGYTSELRTFASTLYLYSPAAYLHVRRKFKQSLPHPTVLNKLNESDVSSMESESDSSLSSSGSSDSCDEGSDGSNLEYR